MKRGATSLQGFNQAYAYSGGVDGRGDIVGGLAFQAPNGSAVAMGSLKGYYENTTLSRAFDFDPSHVIVGWSGMHRPKEGL